MPIIRIDQLDDARLDLYRDLRDKVLRKAGGRFIAEGWKVTCRLLEAGWPVESVLVAQRRAQAVAPRLEPHVPLYVVTEELLTQTAGFPIHTGILAIGRRIAETTLEQLLGTPDDNRTTLLLVCSQLKETANLGSIVRISAALGVDGLIIGPHCCDPFYRRAIRVSMGAVFGLPIVRSVDLAADLHRLRDAWGVQTFAAVVDRCATALPRLTPPRRAAVVLGHEVDGLEQHIIDACAAKVTIPMHGRTDSLNVAMSAAVFAYHFKRATP
jgi:tRNA G18 (ribose-2'-O)-methylase SpoU